jgi:cobalamin synthase
MAGPFVREKSEARRCAALALGLALIIPFGPVGLLCFMAAWLLIGLFRLRCRDQFGGITGDLLGTANEMIMLALLLGIAFSGARMTACTGWLWVFK